VSVPQTPGERKAALPGFFVFPFLVQQSPLNKVKGAGALMLAE
jgi:hypothetical protein